MLFCSVTPLLAQNEGEKNHLWKGLPVLAGAPYQAGPGVSVKQCVCAEGLTAKSPCDNPCNAKATLKPFPGM